jgi:hypothetical protein
MPPELAKATPGSPSLVRVDVSDFVTSFFQKLVAARVDTSAFDYQESVLFLDPEGFKRANVNRDSVARWFADSVKHVRGVARADLFSAILKADTLHDSVARRWRHAIPPDVPVAVVVTPTEGSVWGSANPGVHGSPSDADAHVPIVFYGPPFKPGRYDVFARVVDLAPTLAQTLGVKPTEPIDGHVLGSALRPGKR